MALNEVLKNYALNDGRISHFEFDFRTKRLNVELVIRKHVGKRKFDTCKVLLTFQNVKLLDILEDIPTDGQYSDVTIIEKENESIYVSFDPYGNSGHEDEQDNWVIKADGISINELLYQ